MRVLHICTFLLFTGFNWAQDTLKPLDHGIQVVARATGASIKLRWAPMTNYTWQKCNENGYNILRYTVQENGELLPFATRSQGVQINDSAIIPWSEADQWRPLMEKDQFAAIAAQALYGENFSATGPGIQGGDPNIIEQIWEQENRFGFGLFAADHSWQTALAMGLAYEDPTVVVGQSYLFRVVPAIEPSNTIDTGIVAIGTNDTYPLPKPLEVVATFGDLSATVKWNQRLFDQFYVSYWVERSTDGINFERAHENPLINTSPDDRQDRSETIIFADSLDSNGTPYFYRILGNTPFGETGPASDIVQGMGIDPTPESFPVITAVLPSAEGTGFDILWQFDTFYTDLLIGFRVRRAEADQGPYTDLTADQLVPADQRFFTDLDPLRSNYYIVEAIDKFNRKMVSYSAFAQLDDTIPPVPPINVRGKVMDNGVMVLTWDANVEDDLLGYRVYAANDPNAEYTQISNAPVTNNYLIDTINLNTLSKELFVQVMALDYRHNPSELSEVGIIRKPDTIAPSEPVIKSIEADTLGILLTWVNSTSSDVAGHRLFRREVGVNKWDTLGIYRWPEEQNVESFLDQDVDVRIPYEYKVVAFDDVNLWSSSDSVQAKMIDNYIRKKIETVGAQADRRDKHIEILWEYHTLEEVESFVIYKGYPDDIPITYEYLNPSNALYSEDRKKKNFVFSFLDDGVDMNTDYKYQIKAVYHDGGESPLSNPIVINF